MEFTGERYIPELETPEISYEHWHRYLYATHFVKSKVVLDVACGEGYGSYLLSLDAEKVVGVDINPETINHASSKYVKANLEFKIGSASKIPIQGQGIFDIIVSFETIEHLTGEDQKSFLREVRRLLKPDGFFMVSTPNKLLYSDIPQYKNPFHLKEFYVHEFEEFLKQHFKHVKLLGQRIYPVSYIWEKEKHSKSSQLMEYKLNMSEKGFRPTEEPKGILYIIAICTDASLEDVSESILVDLSEKILTRKDQHIANLEDTVQSLRTRLEGEQERLMRNVIEKQKEVQALQAQLTERVQMVQALQAQLAEREQAMAALQAQATEQMHQVQALSGRLREITISKAWRVAMLLRRIRVFLVPPSSWRAHLLKKLFAILFSPFREVRQWLTSPSLQAKRYVREVAKLAKAAYKHLPLSQRTRSSHQFLLERHAPWLLRLASGQPIAVSSGSWRITKPAKPVVSDGYVVVEPRVSIVIVAYNKSEYTIECLRSVWKHTLEGVPFEVIVVDNGSEPRHRESVKPYLGYARMLELGVNRGFGEANNIAVEYARGEFVMFLNNDAMVTTKWLEPLMRVMDEHPDAGAVGAKLVYPDGSLQEAGAFLRADGTTYQRGKGDNPDKPKYSRLEVVDYCSASALLVRKELFLRSLGFDLSYDPAYYEDVDLCLKLERLGYRTYYCPETTIIHHENATSSDASLNQGLHDVVEVNRQKFLVRWQDRLRLGSGTSADGAISTRLRVGLFTPYNLMPGGGERYLLSIAAALRSVALVDLITPHQWSRMRLLTVARELSLDVGEIRPVSIDQARDGRPYDIFMAMGNEVIPPVIPLGKRNIFICQFPFSTDETIIHSRRTWLKLYHSVIVYSCFTREHLRKRFAQYGLDISIPIEIIVPPVSLMNCGNEAKRPIILNVGRFFVGGHNKKQLELVQTFKRMFDQGHVQGWELHLAGAVHPEFEHREYVLKIIEEAAGYPIKLHLNPPLQLLQRLYCEACIYWHATGFDVDENKYPEQHEHFGISTVEAMSAGCIPIVIATAGQREIVQDGENGFLWRTLDELQEKTLALIDSANVETVQTLRLNAKHRATAFGSDVFSENIRRYLGLA